MEYFLKSICEVAPTCLARNVCLDGRSGLVHGLGAMGGSMEAIEAWP